MHTKVCTSCKFDKPLDDFHNQKKGKFGKDSICKPCRKVKDRLRRGTDEYREKNRQDQQRYRELHLEAARKSVSNSRRRRRKANPERELWMAVKYRAKYKNLPFNLEPEDIQFPEFCPALGIKLNPFLPSHSAALPSVDRVRPELGYVKGNIRIISHRANRIKCDASLEEIRAVERYVTKAYESQPDPSSS